MVPRVNQMTYGLHSFHYQDTLGTTSIPTFVTQNGQWPFLTPTPLLKMAILKWENFQHSEGIIFEVESIGLALCQYVTGAGFPPRPS